MTRWPQNVQVWISLPTDRSASCLGLSTALNDTSHRCVQSVQPPLQRVSRHRHLTMEVVGDVKARFPRRQDDASSIKEYRSLALVYAAFRDISDQPTSLGVAGEYCRLNDAGGEAIADTGDAICKGRIFS